MKPASYSILKNKYFIVVALFILWMTFFDPKDWGLIADRRTKLRELQKSEEELNEKISDSKSELAQLKSNVQTVERYARENYMMKKDNEDVFLVKTP